MQLSEDVRSALTSGRLAHLVTLEPDGTAEVTLVWVGVEDGEIVAGHLGVWRKVANVGREPRWSFRWKPAGIPRWRGGCLVVHGSARIRRAERLSCSSGSHVYLGRDVKVPAVDNPPPGYITRITPEKIGGVGTWRT